MSEEFPLAVSKADIYYAYPFVLDFQLLKPFKEGESHLKSWIAGEGIEKFKDLREVFPLMSGLPETRLGFPPILPYRALIEEFGHFNKPEDPKSDTEALLTVMTKEGEDIVEVDKNIRASKTFVVKECGNGALTYKLTVERESDSQSAIELLNPIIRLVPKGGKPEFRKEESLLSGGIFGDERRALFGHVRSELLRLEFLLEKCFGRENPEGETHGKEHVWEDREVLCIEDSKGKLPWGLDRPFVQPFAFIVLYLKGKKYNYDSVRKLLAYLSEGKGNNREDREEREAIAKALLAIVYRFWELSNYRMTPLQGTHLLNMKRILTINDYMTCFFYHTAVLAVIDDSGRDENAVKGKNFVEKCFTPVILNSVENAVSRAHFAYILDGLLDKQIKELSTASFDQLSLYSQKLAKAKSQTAMFLQNIGQYIKGGNLGSEILTMLDDVLRIEALEKKLLEKIRLATDSLFDYTRYRFSELYEDKD